MGKTKPKSSKSSGGQNANQQTPAQAQGGAATAATQGGQSTQQAPPPPPAPNVLQSVSGGNPYSMPSSVPIGALQSYGKIPTGANVGMSGGATTLLPTTQRSLEDIERWNQKAMAEKDLQDNYLSAYWDRTQPYSATQMMQASEMGGTYTPPGSTRMGLHGGMVSVAPYTPPARQMLAVPTPTQQTSWQASTGTSFAPAGPQKQAAIQGYYWGRANPLQSGITGSQRQNTNVASYASSLYNDMFKDATKGSGNTPTVPKDMLNNFWTGMQDVLTEDFGSTFGNGAMSKNGNFTIIDNMIKQRIDDKNNKAGQELGKLLVAKGADGHYKITDQLQRQINANVKALGDTKYANGVPSSTYDTLKMVDPLTGNKYTLANFGNMVNNMANSIINYLTPAEKDEIINAAKPTLTSTDRNTGGKTHGGTISKQDQDQHALTAAVVAWLARAGLAQTSGTGTSIWYNAFKQ